MINNAIVALTGDLHVNSTVALCPPFFELDDGGEYRASKQQKWIWRKWKDYWATIKELKESLEYPVFTALNGEVVDDLNHRSTQLVTKNPADQLKLANKALEPAHEVTDHYIVCRGTEAHSGPSSALDEILAEDIGAIKNEDSGNYSWENFRGEIAGVRFDIAHHPGMGHSRAWGRGGDANRLAATIVFRYAEQMNIERGVRLPHLAIRGHNHKKGDSGDNFPVRAIILPSWQLTNAFGHRLGGDWLSIGGAYVICTEGNEPKVFKKFYDWPIGKIWTTQSLVTTN